MKRAASPADPDGILSEKQQQRAACTRESNATVPRRGIVRTVHRPRCIVVSFENSLRETVHS